LGHGIMEELGGPAIAAAGSRERTGSGACRRGLFFLAILV
jgi:hypothetical protein